MFFPPSRLLLTIFLPPAFAHSGAEQIDLPTIPAANVDRRDGGINAANSNDNLLSLVADLSNTAQHQPGAARGPGVVRSVARTNSRTHQVASLELGAVLEEEGGVARGHEFAGAPGSVEQGRRYA